MVLNKDCIEAAWRSAVEGACPWDQQVEWPRVETEEGQREARYRTLHLNGRVTSANKKKQKRKRKRKGKEPEREKRRTGEEATKEKSEREEGKGKEETVKVQTQLNKTNRHTRTICG